MGSILTETKKLIGITESDTSFDLDMITHINSTFSILKQLGIGPDRGFSITDKTTDWDEYLRNDNDLNMVHTYMFLRTKLAFDPPGTSFAIDALKDQIAEFEGRISIDRELGMNPIDPMTGQVIS